MMEQLRKRPLLFAAVSLCLGITLRDHLDWGRAALAVWGIILAGAVFLASRRQAAAAIVAVMLPLGGFLLQTHDRPIENDAASFAPSDKTVFVAGQVVSDVRQKTSSYGEPYTGFVLEATDLWQDERLRKPKALAGKLRVTLRGRTEPLEYGDRVILKGRLAPLSPRRNPGGYDQKASLGREGIRALFYAKGPARVLKKGAGWPIQAAALEAKRFFCRRFESAFAPREAAFLESLFFGDRSDLEIDFLDLFAKTGTLHLLAVSGFNVGFVAGLVFLLLRPIPLPRDWRLLAALTAVWGYCLLVGWQAPVLRATIMATFFLGARLFGLRADALNLTGAAALLILAMRPRELFDAGFQLSFLCVAAIILFVPRFLRAPALLPNERRSLREKAVFYFRELFWVSFVCFACTLPLTASRFYLVTPLSVIANLAAVPATAILFFIGALFLIVGGWAPTLAQSAPSAAWSLLEGLTGLLAGVRDLPGAYWVVGEPPWWAQAFLWAGIAYFLWAPRLRHVWVRAAAIFLFSTSVLLLQGLARHLGPAELKMTVLDVGQGEAIFLEFPDGGNLLVDAGRGGDGDRGLRVVVPFLRQKGVKALDAVLVSHPQEDHFGGMASVLDELPVRHLFEADASPDTGAYRRFLGVVNEKRVDRHRISAGDRIEGYGSVKIEVLGPAEGAAYPNLNDRSVVLKVSYGKTSFLLTGDIEEAGMRALLASDMPLQADVLKVPHHGARVKEAGSEFFARTRPSFAVISAGERNPFGHPHPETLMALASAGEGRVLRTDQSGAVEFVSDGRTVRASGFIRQK